nr:Protein SYS-1, isoform a [Haemonchus contortus]
MDAKQVYDQQIPSTSQFSHYPKPEMMQQYPPACRQNMQHMYPASYPRSPSRVPQTDHTSHWLSGPYNAVYANSPVPSGAPSVMSHVSMQDDLVSVMSVQTTLNASTAPCPQDSQLTELRPQSQFSSSASTPPCTENVDPATLQEVRRNIAYSINNFYSNEQFKIIQCVCHYAQRNMLQFVDMGSVHKLLLLITQLLKNTIDPNFRRQNSLQTSNLLLNTIFYLSRNQTTLRVVMHVASDKNTSEFIYIIAHFAKVNLNWAAALTLHTLFDYNGPEGAKCITYAKQIQPGAVLDALLHILKEKPDRKRTLFVLHSLQLLARKDNNAKQHIVQSYNGRFIELLIGSAQGGLLVLADNARDQGRLLYRILALLNVVMASQTAAELFVRWGGLQKVCERLYQSTDVLREGIHLIALASDVKTVDDQDLRVSIRQVLDILCRSNDRDLFVRRYSSGFLVNVIANRPVNKRLLIECNAFDIFTRLCYQYSNLEQWSQTKEMRNMLEELVDNILLCLNSLIVEPLKPDVTKARDTCLSQKSFQVCLLKLLSNGSQCIRARVLRLMTLLLSCCAGWGATVTQAVLEDKGENIIGVVFNVISITRADATDDNRRETVNILTACFRVLNLVMFCDEGAKKTVTLFARNSPVSLMELLRTFTEDNLVVQILETCDRVADDENLAQLWASDRPLIDANANSSHPEIARAAQSLVSKLSVVNSDFEPLAGVFASMGTEGFSMEM